MLLPKLREKVLEANLELVRRGLWEDAAPSRVLDSFTLTGNDLKAHNGFEAPQNVAPKPLDKPTTSNHRTRLELPARSYTIIQFAV